MSSPTPAHDFGLLAAGLAQALDRAMKIAHPRHADPYEPAESCTHDLCRDANRLLLVAEKSACRAVDANDFADHLAGYADGIATCVLRHEGATGGSATLILAATERTLRTAAMWLESDKDSDMLVSAANAVKAQGADELCCPVCEEIECDDDCPLAVLRSVQREGGT